MIHTHPNTNVYIGSLGVLGLYISVVLVVGQFVRLFTQRISQRIVFEVRRRDALKSTL